MTSVSIPVFDKKNHTVRKMEEREISKPSVDRPVFDSAEQKNIEETGV